MDRENKTSSRGMRPVMFNRYWGPRLRGESEAVVVGEEDAQGNRIQHEGLIYPSVSHFSEVSHASKRLTPTLLLKRNDPSDVWPPFTTSQVCTLSEGSKK